MKYFIGIDGGGTKTAFLLSGIEGKPFASRLCGGCSYQTLGVEATVRLLHGEVRQLLKENKIAWEDCAGCAVGLPCYGENAEIDAWIAADLRKAFDPIPLYVVNDVEVGWAGSLACGEGIHVVAGTGSIAFGKGKGGQSARCGGWNEFYGDEGSCYWIGRQAMSLFSKEADGRAPRGAMYEIVRKELGLLDDFYFTTVIQEEWAPFREKVAAFQTFAFRAAEQGDAAAAALYADAARELGQMVQSILNRVHFSKTPVTVSYSGGLFKTGELALRPFRAQAEALGCILQAPMRTAAEGALLLAIGRFDG